MAGARGMHHLLGPAASARLGGNPPMCMAGGEGID